MFSTPTGVPRTVTFTFKRKKRVKTVTYVPSAGSPYTAAAVTGRVRVRGR